MMIFAIDPGPVDSAYVLIDEDYRILGHGKLHNYSMLRQMDHSVDYVGDNEDMTFAIERIGAMGMTVGQEVFDTAYWAGRFAERARSHGTKLEMVFRREVKAAICQHSGANDRNIIQALRDRFAYNVRNYGKGTKKAPGWFYGVTEDVWQAYALAVTVLDRYKMAQQWAQESGLVEPALCGLEDSHKKKELPHIGIA